MSRPSADLHRLERHDATTDCYRIAIITDEDKAARVEFEGGEVAWRSLLRLDHLYRRTDPETGAIRYDVEPIPPEEGGEQQLVSPLSQSGRGAEFSELVMFGERLLAFDDRTGLVCEIRDGNRLVPRQILMEGCGDERFKGFKSEWATLQGDTLVVGSHGKEAAQAWIKCLDRDYGLRSLDWHRPYERMREALGVAGTPGYVVHEAAEWHPLEQRWYFFPRKISTTAFDPETDERECGANRLVVADADFDRVEVRSVGTRYPDRGVSSFKLVPGRPNECIGIRSLEVGDETASWLFCFDLDGNVLAPDVYLGPYKCEGVEIL